MTVKLVSNEKIAETSSKGNQEKWPDVKLRYKTDALFLNDDRHLNSIAVPEQGGLYDYCPIFDNGAGLLSNVQTSPMEIQPAALIPTLQARPFNMTFNRQAGTAQRLYGSQLRMPRFCREELMKAPEPLLPYYAQRDRGLITDRVCECILTRQKFL